ncbi:hypothetical protein [Streptomyces sp. NBC_00057]
MQYGVGGELGDDLLGTLRDVGWGLSGAKLHDRKQPGEACAAARFG